MRSWNQVFWKFCKTYKRKSFSESLLAKLCWLQLGLTKDVFQKISENLRTAFPENSSKNFSRWQLLKLTLCRNSPVISNQTFQLNYCLNPFNSIQMYENYHTAFQFLISKQPASWNAVETSWKYIKPK